MRRNKVCFSQHTIELLTCLIFSAVGMAFIDTCVVIILVDLLVICRSVLPVQVRVTVAGTCQRELGRPVIPIFPQILNIADVASSAQVRGGKQHNS